MRILYICGDQGIPVFGRKGASTHIREMIRAFRAEGHEIMLAAPDLSGDRLPEEDFPTVQLPAPKSKLLGSDGRYVLANLRSFSILKKAAKDFGAEAIYERSALYFTAGERIAAKLGLPRVLEVNALLAEEQKTRLHYPNRASAVEERLVTNARAVASISIVMKRRLESMGRSAESTRVFTMAVNPKRFQPEDSGAVRRELGWKDDDLVFGYVGSMNHYHRPAWYVELAQRMLERKKEGRRFLIVGGSDRKVERNAALLAGAVAEGRVHFTGSVPQADMTKWLSLMDAVLIPGAAPQSTPTKIFEAAAVGRPLIMPATEPISHMAGEESICLFDQEDFAAFEERVLAFEKNPAPFHAERDRLRELICRDYTWQHHAREIAAWLQDL